MPNYQCADKSWVISLLRCGHLRKHGPETEALSTNCRQSGGDTNSFVDYHERCSQRVWYRRLLVLVTADAIGTKSKLYRAVFLACRAVSKSELPNRFTVCLRPLEYELYE